MVRIKFGLQQLTSGFVIPLLVLTIAAAGYFFLLPKYKELQDEKRVLAARENEVARQEAQLISVRDLLADLNRKEEQLAVLDQALPTAPAVPELLANLEALTQSSGLLATTLQITIPSTLPEAGSGQNPQEFKRLEGILGSTENLSVLQIDMILTGQYPNLKTFLTNLEQNLRLMDILSLTFTPVEKSGDQAYALKIQTYYYKPQK